MPVSNRSPLSVSLGSAAKVFYALVVTSLLLVWFNQQSIRLYCQQKYHDDCEIPGLSQNPQWRFGAQLNQALENARVAFVGSFAATADLSLVAQAEAAAELKAKQEAEAKAAAELKAKQEAEAKAKAKEKAEAEAKAKLEASKKKSTITCVKGKITKKVTAVKPKCPKGYKKK